MTKAERWRRGARTVLQIALGIAVTLPVVIDATGLTPADAPWLATIVAAAAVFARVMQSPVVEALLQRFAPWLAASPALLPPEAPEEDEHDGPEEGDPEA